MVESEPGTGSTFSFTARLGRSKKPEWSGATRRGPLEGLDVLVVDDNLTSRELLIEWLLGWGMRPAGVADATSALDALEHARRAAMPYRLVLLDARMPGVDGLVLAGRIRERFGRSSQRVILLGSEHGAAIEPRSAEAGIHAIVVKPVQPAELLETIWELLTASTSVEQGASPRAAAKPTLGARGLRVLVAEDNELNVALLIELLGQRDHRVQAAGDGETALALASAVDFDLMLLDLHMPVMDGFEVVRAIRERERGTTHHLPIVALTARSSARDRDRALAAGMDAFLVKPLDVDALWSEIDRIACAPDKRSRLIDARVIAQTCGGRAAVLDRLSEMFRHSVPVQLAATHAALEDRDFAHLRSAAHALAGTLSAFSTIAGALASSLEDAAGDQELATCISISERLDAMCELLVEETRGLTLGDLT